MITIVENEEYLRQLLSQKDVSRGNGLKYFSYKSLTPKTEELITAKGLTKIGFNHQDENFRTEFIQNYLSLINAISEENNNRVWWASDVASRNRYSSMLPDLLEEFMLTLKSIQQESFDQLVIVAPSWEIVPSLTQALIKKNTPVRYLGNELKQKLKFRYQSFYKGGAVVYNALKVIGRILWAKLILNSHIDKQFETHKTYYVIKSFIYNHSFVADNKYQDVFFGRLPEFIKDNREVIIMANVIGDYRYCIDQIKKCKSFLIIPVEFFMSFLNVIKALKEFFLTKIKLNRMTFFEEDVSEIVRNVLVKNYKGIKFPQFMHYWATKKFLGQVKTDTFVMTYENYPWERMTILALREFSSNTKIVGYQHTVVPQAYLNYFISKAEQKLKLLPDKILTTGAKTKDIMQRYGKYENIALEPSCGLRFEYLYKAVPKERRKPIQKILVALESAWDAYEIVQYVVNQLKDHPEIEVRIRTHTLLPWSAYVKRYGNPIAGYNHFKIANGPSLEEEINQVDALIYWGTTVSLEALMMGKPIIHYNKGNVLSFDPLFDCCNLKWTLNHKSSLIETIREIESISDEEFDLQKDKAREYLEQYFHPVLDENLEKFAH